MKNYFLTFDYYGHGLNSFYYGIIAVDLQKNDITDIVKEIIKERYPNLNLEEITIKITALNNIDI